MNGFFPGGWLTAIPLLFLLEGKSLRARALLGWGWGVLAHGLFVAWLYPVSPAGYFVLVAAWSLQGLFFGILMFSFRPAVIELFYIPCAWVLSEYLCNMLLGGFTYGLGMSQAMVPEFIQPARLGGVYAVSWLMVFFAAACYLRVRRKGIKAIKDPPTLMLIFFPLCVWIAGAAAMAIDGIPQGRPLRAVLVQPDISRADKASAALYDANMARHLALSQQGAQGARPDIIIWPETAFPDDIMRDAAWRPRMEAAARELNSWLIFGSALISDDGHDLNALLFLDPRGKWRDVYYKRHLVPFSEYLPPDPLSGLLARAGGMKSYHFLSGRRRGLVRLEGLNTSAGLAICSEEAYPDLFRDLAQHDAGFFISVLNDGWFPRPEALKQHAGMAVFRAVETGRPLLRAANTGWSIAIDRRGRVVRASVLQSPGWVSADLHPGVGTTVYTRFGDLFVWLCAGFVIIVLMRNRSGTRRIFKIFDMGRFNMSRAWLLAALPALLLTPADANAAAAVQRRVQQQKQMQAQAAAQYQQQMMAQQQAQVMAQQQAQQQQVAAYQQAQAQKAAQQAAAQKAAAEYAAQKQAMEAALAQKQAQEQQVAQVVSTVQQEQAQQAARYQQAVVNNNVTAMMAYKQQQEAKAITEAQQQAQLNGDIKQYAEYTAKRNALMQAQAAQTAQEGTERQLLASAATQNATVMKQRSALNAAYQEDVRRRLGQQAADEVLAGRAMDTGALNSSGDPVAETTVGLQELWTALDHSARPWAQIVDREIKLLTVSEFIDRFRKAGIVINHPPGEYVGKLDSLTTRSPDLLKSPFGNLLSYAAIIDYDFNNGKNKDEMARQLLGDANFWANKRRIQGK